MHEWDMLVMIIIIICIIYVTNNTNNHTLYLFSLYIIISVMHAHTSQNPKIQTDPVCYSETENA